MNRPNEDVRHVPITGLQADILTRLAELLATKDVPDGVVYLVGAIPKLWDEAEVVDLDEQLAIFDEYHARAHELVVDRMIAEHENIRQEARRRFTNGFAVFRDEMFRRHPGVLYADMLEELADAVNYQVAAMWARDHAVTTKG